MKYSERIAAGWKPKWGIYRDADDMWLTDTGFWFHKPAVGKRAAPSGGWDFSGDLRPRRYWVKPKVKPAEKRLGMVARLTYFKEFEPDTNITWEKAAQAVADELVRRMRAHGLNGSADVLVKLAKETP